MPKRQPALPESFYQTFLLVDAEGRGRCYIVKPTGIVRYHGDHSSTAECSTLRLCNYAFATCLCRIVCSTTVPLECNLSPILSSSPSHTVSFLKKKHVIACISILFVDTRQRHMTPAGTQHASLSAFAPVIGTLLSTRAARALPHSLPPEQRLLAECLPQPHDAVCTNRPILAGIPAVCFPQS